MQHSRMVRRVCVVVVSLVAASFMAGAGYAKELQPLKVSYLNIADVVQLYVGWEKGFFEEEGLKVEGQVVPGGAMSQTLVESGSVDLGWTAVIPLSSAYVKGFNFAFIAPGAVIDSVNYKMAAVVVKKDSPIQSFKDLAGKRIATNALNNLNHLSVLTFADFYGIDPKGLKFVEIPMPAMPAAIKEGAVDAADLVDPFVTIAVNEGIAKVIQYGFFPLEIAPRTMPAGWFAKRSSLDKNKDKIERFIRAIDKATAYINKNPDQMPAIIAKYTKQDINLLQKIVKPRFAAKTYKKDIQVQIDLCAKFGFIPKGFDATEVVATQLFPLE